MRRPQGAVLRDAIGARDGLFWSLGRKTVLALVIVGCDADRVLDVADIEVASPESLRGAAALPAIHAGAVGDFGTAYAGNQGEVDQVQLVALFTDESHSSDTFGTRNQVDQRQISEDNTLVAETFREIQKGRAAADFASNRFVTLGFPNDVRRAEATSLAGYAIVLMAENFCSGVPLSTLTETGVIEYGPPRSTVELWSDALAKFDSALIVAGSSVAPPQAVQRNLASIGRGRALLNAGRFQEAATAVASVPTNFVYRIWYSINTARENNAVWVLQRTSRRYSASEKEGGTGLPYRSDGDPRTPQVRPSPSAVGFDGITAMYYQDKYPLRESPIPLAAGTEARLIEAEAAQRRGDQTTYLARINEVRALHGLAALALPPSGDERVDLLFKERAYTMWFTAHRLGDLRRLVRQYGRVQSAVFPTGPFHKGGTYGADVNWIIPLDEKNNPLFTGCLDRGA